jgi:predicted porin
VNTKYKAALIVGAVSALSTAAYADNAPTPDGTLTWYGITLYGTVDAGIQYTAHGAPQSDYFGPGSQELIAKQSDSSEAIIGGNNLSQSKLGIKVKEDFGNGWSGVAKLESAFNPWSGQLTDGPRSLTENNGKAAGVQEAAGSSSLAGQLFASAAYLGISNAQFGTLTFGRNTGILHDGIAIYDPMGTSYAFSPIGNSGVAAGGGDTEDRRLDNSVKYDVLVGPLHLGAQFQSKSEAHPGTAQEFVVGASFDHGSIDAYYMQRNDAVSFGALSAAQLTSISQVCSGTAVANIACVTDYSKAVAGTVSDNTSYAVMGKYKFDAVNTTVFAGFEQIRYQNPSDPVGAGITGLGGYVVAAVNVQSGADSTYPNTKQLTISWIGAKYALSPKWEINGAYYRYDQNNYGATGYKGWTAGCSSTASALCSGSENFVSVDTIYHATKRFDLYAGAMWNQVQGGLAAGFAFATATIDPTIGFRYNF